MTAAPAAQHKGRARPVGADRALPGMPGGNSAIGRALARCVQAALPAHFGRDPFCIQSDKNTKKAST